MNRLIFSPRYVIVLFIGWMATACTPLFSSKEAASPTSPPSTPTAVQTALPDTLPTLTATALPLPTKTPTAVLIQPMPTLPLMPTATFASGEAVMALSTLQTWAYVLQSGSPSWMPNIFHPESGCNWLGVAGFVFGMNSQPVEGLVVEVGGILEGEAIYSFTMTGLAPIYGPGAYELPLSDHAIASDDALWVRVKDLQGIDLSAPMFFDTFSTCEQNLTMINFVQASEEWLLNYFYLPFLVKDNK